MSRFNIDKEALSIPWMSLERDGAKQHIIISKIVIIITAPCTLID